MDYLTAALFGAGIVGTVVILREYMIYKVERATVDNRAPIGQQNTVQNALGYIEEAQRRAQESYDDAIKRGATPDQLKSLKGNIDMLTWVKIGAPYLDPILKGFSRMFK